MAFFEQLGETITNASNSVAHKTKTMTEISNLNKQISSNQNVIQNMYFELGRRFYELHKDEPENECAEQCRVINEAFKNIALLQDQIRYVKGIAICPSCGAEVVCGSPFCSACGNKLELKVPGQMSSQQPGQQADGQQGAPTAQSVIPQMPVTQQPVEKICVNCGSTVPVDSAFCPVCGQKM